MKPWTMTEEKKTEMRQLRIKGVGWADIARTIGCSVGTVRHYLDPNRKKTVRKYFENNKEKIYAKNQIYQHKNRAKLSELQRRERERKNVAEGTPAA